MANNAIIKKVTYEAFCAFNALKKAHGTAEYSALRIPAMENLKAVCEAYGYDMVDENDVMDTLNGIMTKKYKGTLVVASILTFRKFFADYDAMMNMGVVIKDAKAPKEKATRERKPSKAKQKKAELEYLKQKLDNGEIDENTYKDKKIAIFEKYEAA